MDPVLYLSALRRRWWLIVGLTVLGLLVGFASGSSAGTRDVQAGQTFVATHTLEVIDPATPSRQSQDRSQPTDPRLDAIPVLLASGDVPARAAELLDGGDDPADLASQVRSSSDTGLGTIDISATDRDATRAVAIADAFAAALIEHLEAEDVARTDAQEAALEEVLAGLEPQINQLSGEAGAAPNLLQQTQLDVLVERYRVAFDELQTLRAASSSSGFVDLGGANTERSTPAEEAFSTPSSRNGRAAIGGLAGFLVGALLVLVMDRLDNTIRSAAAAEAALEMPVLVSVPLLPAKFRRRSALPALGAAPDFDEAMRVLRSMLMVASERLLLRGEESETRETRSQLRLQTILVTSANASEGKSTLVAALGRMMGLAPSRVIVLDLDLRQPTLHRLFGVPARPGVADLFSAARPSPAETGTGVGSEGLPRAESFAVLPPAGSAMPSEEWMQDTGPAPLDGILVEVAPGLRLAPAGTGYAPTHLLCAGTGLVEEARTRADVVLIDAPPLLAVSEASDLLPAVDGVVVAVFAGRTTVADAVALRERLALLGAPVVGAVLIGATRGGRSRRAYRTYVRPAHLSALATDSPDTAPPIAVEEASGIGSP